MAGIRDVAAAANVSIATVSRVISQSGYPVSEETRERVERAARELGYLPNDLARSLLHKRTNSVGLIVQDAADHFYADVARGVEHVAGDYGFVVLFCNSARDPARRATYLTALRGKRVDGIFVAGGASDFYSEDPVDESFPKLVAIGRYAGLKIPTVEAENRKAGIAATEHLLELGHERIAFIRVPRGATAIDDRVRGYRAALKRAGRPLDPALVVEASFEEQSGYRAAQALLARDDAPTAIIVANDRLATGAMAGAIDAGRRVPHDVAFVGFGDNIESRYLRPSLTTVALPSFEMGARAMRLMLQLLSGEPGPTTVHLATELRVRQSTVADA